MLKIGLTGGIGSGKSLICEIFSELGVPVYVADDEAKKLMDGNTSLKGQISDIFGEKAYVDGKLNRKYIGSIVFKEAFKLKKLNALIHPVVQEHFQQWAKDLDENPYVIEEAAILFESGASEGMDYTIYVKAEESLRISRVVERDKVTVDAVRERIASQWPEIEKEKRADFIIYNEKDSMILPQIVDLHKTLLELNR